MSDITIDDFPSDGLVSLAQWRTDPEVHQFLRPGLRTVEAVHAWYDTYFSREENRLFALYYQENLIGYGTLERLDVQHRSGEIGLVIGEKPYWKQGIGSAAVKALTDMAFKVYHMHRVFAVIHDGNRASMHGFAQAGFRHEGRLREARYVHGHFIDLHYYAVLEEEWAA
jgi:RimJ/RimL family protein N-acetyltransferase